MRSSGDAAQAVEAVRAGETAQTLDAVRALAGLAAGLARSSAPVLLAGAVALHTA
ncbi:hypothetical protein [Rathayibacter sp. AY1C4]|nr:hypothetical protein [Rathayibacter sp. AY1C4]